MTIQFHDDNQRCKSRLQYRNPRRPRTGYKGVVLDSFFITSVLLLARACAQAIILLCEHLSLQTAIIQSVSVDLNDSIDSMNRFAV